MSHMSVSNTNVRQKKIVVWGAQRASPRFHPVLCIETQFEGMHLTLKNNVL